MILVTPGVRSAGASAADQKRIATPAEAIANGADYLVIGRQITRAADPRAEMCPHIKRNQHVKPAELSDKKLVPSPIFVPKFSATVWPISDSVARVPRFTPRRAFGPYTSRGTYSRL